MRTNASHKARRFKRGLQRRRENSHWRGLQAVDQIRSRQLAKALRSAVHALGAWPFAPLDPSTFIQLRRYTARARTKASRQRRDVMSLIESLRPVDGGVELIRLGLDGDGGYLVPDDLEGIEYAFSPGVGSRSGFERDLAARGMQVFQADASVDGPALAHPAFAFEKKHVGSFSSPTTMTLDEWKQQSIANHGGDLLLQMDIESAEYETLTSVSPELLSQFRIIVVEFHDLPELWNRAWFVFASRVFERLLITHTVVHIHPNNDGGSVKKHGIEIPSVAEFTFLRNDRVLSRAPRDTFPHPLDQDCSRDRPALVLPRFWYRPG